jgi:hypothetical protein
MSGGDIITCGINYPSIEELVDGDNARVDISDAG